jgi:hypothetical protein
VSRPTDGLGWLLVALGVVAAGLGHWAIRTGPLATTPVEVRLPVYLLGLGLLWLTVHLAARRGR